MTEEPKTYFKTSFGVSRGEAKGLNYLKKFRFFAALRMAIL
jgi:hypothetical protein